MPRAPPQVAMRRRLSTAAGEPAAGADAAVQARTVTSGDDDLLRSPFTVLRQVSAARDCPWDGTLVGLDGGRGVLVDAERLGADWPGWRARADAHVVAPLDVVRRGDGHDALLPAFRGRLADALSRRGGAAALDDGEAVTVGVSALRAVGELGGAADGMPGEWWITEDGRPVLAIGVGAADARTATVDLLTELAQAPGRRHWDEARAAAGEHEATPRLLARAEDALFRTADAAPIATEGLAPRPARTLSGADSPSAPAADDGGETPWFAMLARHVDADLADTVSAAVTDVWRRARAPRRRRPWLVAAVIGAAVVAGGLLWPGGAGSPAVAEPAPSATITATRATDPAGASIDDDAIADLAGTAAALLDARLACASSAECLGAVLEDPGRTLPPGPIDLAPQERVVVLLDDLGGVAVVRVDAADGGSQLAVIVQRDGRWLLRDVHDVTQQP